MSFEKKEGSGALFKNKDKQSESHADYNGDILINGHEYWLNAWLKTSKNGVRFMSVSAKPKDKSKTVASALRAGKEQAQARKSQQDDFNDEIPF